MNFNKFLNNFQYFNYLGNYKKKILRNNNPGGNIMQNKVTIDGNEAAAYASYAFTEVAAIFPITPSSPMAELIDEWSANGKKNLFDMPVKVVQMQSEAGAAGAMHGSLQSGALTSTYTASQGLLLMIPNIYKMVGELLPGVLHVSARALAAHALSIFGDHQDVMACRQTGACMLASSNVQEVMDLAFIAHLAAITARLPFIHFFDGFRTSHEYKNIEKISYSDIKNIVDYNAIDDFRFRSQYPSNPRVKGTAQNPDIYFQGREIQNKFFDAAADIVSDYMAKVGQITGRNYKPFDYYGPADAENIIVAMGSVCDTIKDTIDYLSLKGEKAGLLQVRLYRPFSSKYFFDALPDNVKKIAVLDRTKEPGSAGEPLYLDVCSLFAGKSASPAIVGGRYGLGSKDTTPEHVLAVYNNLRSDSPKNNFTIGITDDVTNTSLNIDSSYINSDSSLISCKFYGLGSDGTVGANKSACKIIGQNTDLNVQAYFSYDSKKSGGTTISHMRISKNPVRAPYLIYCSDYIACHNKSFIYNYDLLNGLKKNGIFVLNCEYNQKSVDDYLPADMKKYIAENNIDFYVINAEKIADQIGLGNRINMIMQSVFFNLASIIPSQKAQSLLKEYVKKNYGHMGEDIVEKNNKAIDLAAEALVKIDVPTHWKEIKPQYFESDNKEPEFISRIQKVMARNEGDSLPVSAFSGMEDGSFPLGTSSYEKRGIAPYIPQWQADNCIQCNQCSYICPHATIRPYLLDEAEQQRAPQSFNFIKAAGKDLSGFAFRVQVSPLDCTGCGNCADICPAKEKALIMKPAGKEIDAQADNWEYAITIKEKPDLTSRNTVKGSQFIRPLLEFNGACPGCGETPYIKLLTQLFGHRMMIANATGCSSIWGASAPSIPYTVNADGCGPAWANSLFEDNAEYGYGMYLGAVQLRKKLKDVIYHAIKDNNIKEELKSLFNSWLDNFDNADESYKLSKQIRSLLNDIDCSENTILKEIKSKQMYLEKRSFWMIGGDGWAYDIGYGGIDQVISTGDDVNIFVLDTEVYSNTGGQSSKSTPAGAVAKFTYKGKRTNKKNLGNMAMSYGNVYVAQIAMGADYTQTIRAISEAESYCGPSIIIAYSPCINHGIKSGMATSLREEKKAVESGYWHLYRYDPRLKEKGKKPFIIDSKPPDQSYEGFIKGEIRYSQLLKTFPDEANTLFKISEKYAKDRYEFYKNLSERN